MYLRIADVNYKIISNAKIPKLNEEFFFKFLSAESNTSEVYIDINKVKSDETRNVPKGISEILKKKYNFSARDLSSTLIRNKNVLKIIQNKLSKRRQINIVKKSNFIRIFDFHSNTLDLFISNKPVYGQQTLFKSEYFVAANFRLIFSSFLTYFDSIMVHSSGLIIKHGAAIFFAPNEGGKTTIVKLSKNKFPILNDDQVILKKENGSIFAHSTPFGALDSGPLKAKVKGIFILKQAKFNKIIRMSPLDVIECLWNEHLLYTSFLPQKNKQIAFSILFDTLIQAPIYRLFFKKHYFKWKLVEDALK